MPEEEIPLFEDWDLGDVRAMGANANSVAKLLGYKAVHGLVNGEAIESSPVAGFDGEHVILVNGKKIKLGEPKKDYVQFCKKIGAHIPTKENPFKIFTEEEISKEDFLKRQKDLADAAKKISGDPKNWTHTT